MTIPPPEATSIRGLLGQLVGELRELGRLYLAAARAELAAGISDLRVAAILLAAALGLLTVAGVVLTVGLVAAVSAVTGLPLWAAALATLAVVLVAGGLCAWLALRRLRRARIVPEKTIAAAKEDLEWASRWTRRA